MNENQIYEDIVGCQGTRSDFVCAYDVEELEARGITAEQAFDIDLDKTIFCVSPASKKVQSMEIKVTEEFTNMLFESMQSNITKLENMAVEQMSNLLDMIKSGRTFSYYYFGLIYKTVERAKAYDIELNGAKKMYESLVSHTEKMENFKTEGAHE